MAQRKVYVPQLIRLVIGPIDGEYSALCDKMAAIESRHGPFAAAFLVGDVFAEGWEGERFLDGAWSCTYAQLTVPIPTYFYHGPSAFPEAIQARVDAAKGGEVTTLAANLHYLGYTGIALAQGLRVAFVGGPVPERGTDLAKESDAALQQLLSSDDLALSSAAPPLAGDADTLHEARAHMAAMAAHAENLAADAARLGKRKPIDLLLTNAWPANIDAFSSAALPDAHASTWGTPSMARVAEAARPRYFFSMAPTEAEAKVEPTTQTCGAFWEREPYENPPFASVPTPPFPSITRFVSLARFANERKARWFMALQIVPAEQLQTAEAAPLPTRPPTTTPSPVLPMAPKRAAAPMDAVRFEGAPPAPAKRRRKGRAARDVAPISPDQCWFCLSNPRLEKHLVVTIGTEVYVALPKGQVPVSSDALVPGGGHVLLIPIAHTPSVYAMEASRASLLAEMTSLKAALSLCYASYGAVPVTWEVVRGANTRAGHTHTQVVPIPKAMQDGAEAAFRTALEAEGLMFEADDVAEAWSDCASPLITPQDRQDYCVIEIGPRRLLVLLRGERFNLQFPRETLTTYLGVPDRAEWKACVRPDEVEAAECDEFKEAFAEYATD